MDNEHKLDGDLPERLLQALSRLPICEELHPPGKPVRSLTVPLSLKPRSSSRALVRNAAMTLRTSRLLSSIYWLGMRRTFSVC